MAARFCPQSKAQICGIAYTIPMATPGTLRTIQLPLQYAVSQANFECASEGFSTQYKLLNPDVNTCALRTCPPGNITVCGVSIPVPSEMKFGETIRLPLPDNVIDQDRAPSPVVLSLQCSGNGYQVDQNTVPSCNIFLCPPAKLTACGETFTVEQAAPLGAAYNTATEKHEHVKVECMGSIEGAPHYAVVDNWCR